MNSTKPILLLLLLLNTSLDLLSQNKFKPGQVWKDDKGRAIQAHGGCLLLHKGVYYWYGENKDMENYPIPNPYISNDSRVDVIGVSCYSSKDLYNWRYEGLALPANKTDSTHDLYYKGVLERPKVIYNEKTGKFVMWMHIDKQGYQYARAGVATSDFPTGPFKYINSVRPDGLMSRDMTLYKDDNGKAYLIFASGPGMNTLHISLLSADYIKPTGKFNDILENETREAPAIFKYKSKYYLISSGLTGWDANPASYAVGDSIMGKWKTVGNPWQGIGKDSSYNSQSTFVFPLNENKGHFIFMADRWSRHHLNDSRYIWVPIEFENNELKLHWKDEWDLKFFDGKKTSK